MTRLDIIRAAMHFPVGCLAAWLTLQNSMAGLIFAAGFMFYEALEDWKINDLSFKDMFGFLLGYGATALVYLAWLR